MTVETILADAVAARLLPELQSLLRAELAAAVAALRQPAQPVPELVTVAAAARMAGVSQCTMRRYERDGLVQAVRRGHSIRIVASSLRPTDPATVARLAREARS